MSEEILKKIYYTPSNPGSLGGVGVYWLTRLSVIVMTSSCCQSTDLPAAFEASSSERVGAPRGQQSVLLTDKQISDWLAGEDAYTLHRTAPLKYKRNRVFVYGIDMQFQADLVDMSAYAKENDNNHFLLTCIDVFSKYAWVRVLKKQEWGREGCVPQKLQTDKGKEFFNKQFQYITKKYITHFAADTELKANIIERFHHSYKAKMFRYLTATNSRRYIDILQDITDGYNASYHRSIKMRPIDVCKENVPTVLHNLYGSKVSHSTNPIFKYKTGDTVRISKVRGPFAKGYENNYTEEFFTVKTCIPLCDYDGDVIDGVFYEAELQKIYVSKNKTFKIEKILDRKRQGRSTKVLVQWLGWPSKFNTWVDEKDVVDVQIP
ncbi:hypothetical protein H4Q32_007311 [Labeo rohita]|uniref:Integrase catalytic domain-containing protein n=1 Tax=Labeo rohita TaxID=84645 RepID=A0ABQ8MFL7_LABRO|nr:hypothetical protein H4Q32_007311 [Labeo rohita]